MLKIFPIKILKRNDNTTIPNSYNFNNNVNKPICIIITFEYVKSNAELFDSPNTSLVSKGTKSETRVLCFLFQIYMGTFSSRDPT